MRINRARGWRRIGIALSVIWLLGFGFFLWSNEIGNINDNYSWQLKMCYAGENIRIDSMQYAKDEQERQKRWAENETKNKECEAQASAFRKQKIHGLYGVRPILLAVDFGTVLVGWLIVWLTVSVVRWINRGFASA